MLTAPVPMAAKGVIVAPWRQDFVDLLPTGQHQVLPNGVPVLAARYTVGNTAALTHAGHRVPWFLEAAGYDWGRPIEPPLRAQIISASLMVTEPAAFILNDLGTGKTRATLWAIDWLLSTGRASRALILAPLSTLTTVWEDEVMGRFPRIRPILLHAHSAAARRKRLRSSDWNVGILNHDGVKTLEDDLGKLRFDIIVVDELAIFRHHTASRFKALNRMIGNARWRWGLTGAPAPNGPWDVWAQVRLINPSMVEPSFKPFKERVAQNVTTFKVISRPGAEQIVHAVMQPAVRFRRADVVDLPPRMFVERTVQMSPTQKKLYEAVRKHMVAEFAGKHVTAVNAGVAVGKLLQIAAGAVYDDARGIIDLHATDRLSVMDEVIEAASGKVIVFTAYRHLTTILDRHLTQKAKTHGRRWSHAMVHGGVGAGARAEIFRAFQHDPEPMCLAAHPGCMAHGLTLTAADTIIWHCPITSLETYEQGNGRITRIGQTMKQLVVNLTGSPIETRLYGMLTSKKIVQDSILKLFEEFIK